LKRPSGVSPDDPLWYRDAIVYELHVRAYADSNADGIGDFQGLTEKLDYLQDLGVTALWLLPFYPSPGRDDGYDISDYTDVNPNYGTLHDTEVFVEEAHKRGLRVITELVVNHTSDQHPWFQRARKAPPGSRWRDFYVWSDDPSKWKEARVIFQDFEPSNWTFDRDAKSYFWHRFYSHQPDLNFESAAVRRALFRVLEFWMTLGVDGMRLDAVPYLYEREGTNCENLPETHEFLKHLRKHLDSKFASRLFLAEANQWPEDAAAYFGAGDECHMNFHFPLMPRLFMSIHMEDRFPVIDILQQTPEIPPNCQWALFLRNHDELTLEMVTDEERDYMVRVYATDPRARVNLGIRRRLAPLLGNDRRRIELMNGLLFSLPGTPVLYYGDEIGMGDNIYLGDRNGVRTPMQWSPDRNAGFSRANPQRLYLPVIIDPEYHYETCNVEAQLGNPHSLLWWMRRLIALRKRFRAFGRGTLQFLLPENRKVLAFIRRWENETILVVANVSRFVQYVELDLSEFRGAVPVELFGRTDFPPIGDLPYLLTLGPHAFYWFAVERHPAGGASEAQPAAPTAPIVVTTGWDELFREDGSPARTALEQVVPKFLRTRRWFGAKARRMKGAHLSETVPLGEPSEPIWLAVFRIDYHEGTSDRYVIPLAVATGDAAASLLRFTTHAIVAPVRAAAPAPGTEVEGVLYDAFENAAVASRFFDLIARQRRVRGWDLELSGSTTRAFRKRRPPDGSMPPASPVRADQSHSSITFGDRFVLKLFRRIEDGVHPELEMARFLTERAGFHNLPAVAGAIALSGKAGIATIAALHEFVVLEADGWTYALDQLDDYFERWVARARQPNPIAVPQRTALELAGAAPPPEVFELLGPWVNSVELLGRRTAELHAALASRTDDEEFEPEPFSSLYQRSLYQAMRNAVGHAFQMLRERKRHLSEDLKAAAQKVLDLEREALRRCEGIRHHKVNALRTRVHGDYHLKQALWTGKDFVIIDFEGEPLRPLGERRIKRSPLRDVASMLRSFEYAAHHAKTRTDEARRAQIDTNALQFSRRWLSAVFLRGYFDVATKAAFLPRAPEELALLLDFYLLDKAVYELRYELENRPEWLAIPLAGLTELLAPS
jgi:maltose alpha-D-glucosyltransferase / alpha-amylase